MLAVSRPTPKFGALEEACPSKGLDQEGAEYVAHERDEYKDSPEAIDDAGDGGEQFGEEGDGGAQAAGGRARR